MMERVAEPEKSGYDRGDEPQDPNETEQGPERGLPEALKELRDVEADAAPPLENEPQTDEELSQHPTSTESRCRGW
jgi:hypothetical protein